MVLIMSREHIERVGRDADDATAARPDYAPIAAFAGAFSGCLTTLNLVAFGLEPYERSAAGAWHLFADELAKAAIRPLPRFVGGADITLELRRAGLTIDRQALHFEWIGGRIGSATSRISPDGTAADQEALSEFSQWLSKRSGRQDWRRSNSLAA